MIFSLNANAQFFKKVFKYSTVYGSYDQSNAIQPIKSFYVTQENVLQETTPRIPNDATYTFGLRKLAFFDYEDKDRLHNRYRNRLPQQTTRSQTHIVSNRRLLGLKR